LGQKKTKLTTGDDAERFVSVAKASFSVCGLLACVELTIGRCAG